MPESASKPKPEATANPKTEESTQNKPQTTSEPKSTNKETTNSVPSNNNSENNFNGNGIVQGSSRHHAKFHNSPSSSGGYDLEPGTKVQILGETNKYYHVKLSNGDTGYIYAPYVERV